jgi:hypothetical protein
VIIVLDVEQADIDLSIGVLACPRCSAVLRPWSCASPRRIRQVDGSDRLVQPRRARLLGLPGHSGAGAGLEPAPARRRGRGDRRGAGREGTWAGVPHDRL